MWSRERDKTGIETERRVEKFQFFPRSRSLESQSQFLLYTEMPLFFTVSGATKETIAEGGIGRKDGEEEGKRSWNCEISWLLELQTLCPSFKSKRLVSCYGSNTTRTPIVTFACAASHLFYFTPRA